MRVKPGIERFQAKLAQYIGPGRMGLITNPSAVDSRLRSTLDILKSTGQVGALFGLEHGVRGNIQAGEKVSTTWDEETGLPVFSLYGERKKPQGEMLEGIAALVFDLQDVGSRFYTYLASLLYLLQAAAQFDLPIFVLDRPNPLGGKVISGNVLKEEYISFVGLPLPIRYGLTIGEAAFYFNQVRGIGARLTVVKLEGWLRDYLWSQTKLSWVPPSPNMPTPLTALVYSGTCLLEGTNLSEGRGTAQPFEIAGAPWISAEKLALALNARGLPGVLFRPTYFTPSFSKYRGELCSGVQLHVGDPQVYEPVSTAIWLLAEVAFNYREFEFLSPSSPEKPFFFDLLAGTSALREILEEKGPGEIACLLEKWEEESAQFGLARAEFLLY